MAPIGPIRIDWDSGEPVERCHAVGYPCFAENAASRATRQKQHLLFNEQQM